MGTSRFSTNCLYLLNILILISRKIKFYNKGRECWGIDGERLNDHGEEFEIKIINNVKIMVPLKNIKKLFIN